MKHPTRNSLCATRHCMRRANALTEAAWDACRTTDWKIAAWPLKRVLFSGLTPIRPLERGVAPSMRPCKIIDNRRNPVLNQAID